MSLKENSVMKYVLSDVGRLLTIKESTLEQIEVARDLLISLAKKQKSKNFSIEMVLGCLELKGAEILKDGKIDINEYLQKAKSHFSIAAELSISDPFPNYGLFKVAILEEDYQEAYTQLKSYELKLKTPSNFSLVYHLLARLLEKPVDIKEGNKNYILGTRVDYEPILCNYHLAETAVKNREYQKAIKHLSVCQSLSERKKLNIDFSSLLSLVNILFSNALEKDKEIYKAAIADCPEIGKRMILAQKLLELDPNDFESNFLFMDVYIDLKAYTPLFECISKLKKMNATEEESATLALYEKVLNEMYIECINLKAIHNTLYQGDKLRKEGLFQEEINGYLETMEKLGKPFPYFYVKIAETYYEMGEYDKALDSGKKYFDMGYLHYVEASILLYVIYSKQGRIEQAKDIAFDCYKKARMKERGISLDSWLSRLDHEYSSKAGDSVAQKKYVY